MKPTNRWYRPIFPKRGKYKGIEVELRGRIPGTQVFKAQVEPFTTTHPITCYIHLNEL